MKNKIFFLLFLLLNPRLVIPLIKGLYLPVYIQYEWLKKYKINTVIDIGAYYGFVSQALRYLFPQASIYAFEPVEKNREKIKSKLRLENFVLSKYALGKKKGVTKFYEYANPSLSSMLKLEENKYPFFTHTNSLVVDITTLDNYFKKRKIEGNAFLKIDTQGTELDILKGGKKLLKHVAIIHVETSFEEIYKGQFLFSDIYKYLTKIGFTYFGENPEAHFYPSFNIEKQVNSIFINTKKLT